jgi:glucose-1-phosphate thymidylyltransferase
MDLRGVVVVEDPDSRTGGCRPARAPALEHVANRPIIHHVLDALEGSRVSDVIVACSTELAGEVRVCVENREARDELRVRYAEQPGPLDFAAALRLAAPLVKHAPCIVHVASGLLGEPLEPFLMHLCEDSPDAVMIVHQGPAPYGRLSAATQEMLHVAELDPSRAALGIAGVCLFGPRALEHAAKADWWTGSDVDLTAVSERVLAAGGSFRVRLADFCHGCSGSAIDLLEINRIALDRLESDPRRRDSNGNRIEGRVHIHDAASVSASVIVGPAVIGAGARIADAYIGPYTAIGAGARIEGAEIERSIVSAGAAITHVGCRLAGSVIGRNARVFRDFSLPRALRLQVGEGTEIALS